MHLLHSKWSKVSFWVKIVAQLVTTLRCEILGFFSSRSLKTREKHITFAQLVFPSWYIFEGSMFTCNGRSWFVQWCSQGQLYLEFRCNCCILQIGVFCRSFLSSNRFSFQMSEFANHVKSWIFSRQIPVNQNALPGNIHGWVQCKFFLLWNVHNPPNLTKNNLGDVQEAGVSSDVRPAFFHKFLKKWIGYVHPLK